MAQSPSNLPIFAALPTLNKRWHTQQRWVIEAAPGAGKSTELPKFVLEQLSAGKKIILVQPRRAAAKTVAQRIAEQLNEPLGQRVGYQVAKEQSLSANTQLIVMTTGVLLQYLASDSLLEDVESVLLDEFHERSWHLDALFALCLQISWLREDFHLVVLSATLPGKQIAEAMQGELIQVPGRQYPVDISYQPTENLTASIVATLANHNCPTLVFLPGRRWIDEVASYLTNRPCYALHSGLTLPEQQAVINAREDNRVILATNIAETSLTIPGIELVIDSGQARHPVVDKTSGLTKLVTRRISRANADQRAGRAGRTQAGQAIRLWSQDEPLIAQPRPDIEHQPLFELYLLLCQIGEQPEQLPWLSPPNPLAWQKARQQAQEWGWVDHDKLTQVGKTAMALATEPGIARLVLSQPDNKQAITLAAHLHCHGDELTLRRSREVDMQLRAWQQLGYQNQAISRSLGDLLAPGFSQLLVPPNATKTLAGQHVSQQLPHWRLVWQATPTNNGLRERNSFQVSESVAEAVLQNNQRTIAQYEWANRQPKKYIATLVHNYLVKREPAKFSNDDWQQAIINRLNQLGIELLLHQQSAIDWYQKYQFAIANQLLADTRIYLEEFSWLADYLAGINKFDASQLFSLVQHQLDPGSVIDSTLPSVWQSPAGTRIKIDYSEAIPCVAVKLQACFGLSSQPNIAGKALRLNLCSPSGQPVAQTTDINFFWQQAYPQVRKELRGRYNKHPWPEDPTTAKATLQTNRQLRNES
ncbi:ATP-dependent helicase C-terminal domain-containing protein [Salinibius halmophilus]|uniref:ATP-dependent helicase C-terminal domain-containing protein n=1 Tax=Salinibius halmophilus TaxID=1853216 RepID=UPI000E667939|nr:ATP-dependent helicase C-terminal domain-containing protein [Salinibius halmophilus]